jgi:hypothetical protein
MVIISDIWDGKTRKLHSHSCSQCGKEFFAPLKAKAKYCSKECIRLRPKIRVELVCRVCDIKFLRKTSSVVNSKSGIYFCSRICKDIGQSISSGLKEIWPSHYGSDKQYRRKLDMDKCISCGEDRKFLLFAHHIDGDRTHNEEQNLECVCANCHIIRHLRLVNDEWSYWTKALTPREEIESLTCARISTGR